MSTPTPDQTYLPASAWPYKPKADTNTDGAGKALLEALREQAPGGQFLFNRTGLWHQGIHIGAARLSAKFDTEQVCAIADGEVIAYKVDSAYRINQTSEDSAEYSTGYFLLKHEIKYPADNLLTFYSLYRHTGKADDYPKAEIYTVQSADGSIGIKDGTNNTVITLSDGNDDQIMIDPTRSVSNKRRPILAYKENGKSWVSGDGLTVFHTSYDSASKQDGGPLIPVLAGIKVQADQDVTLATPIKVKAGDVLGKPGIYQQLKQSDKSKLIQLDVFTYDDITAFAEKAKTASEQAEQAQAAAAATTAAANTVAGTTGTTGGTSATTQTQASNQAILQPLPKNLLVIPKGSDLFQKIQITKTIAGIGGGATLRTPKGVKIDGTPETPSVDDLPADTPITIEEAANSKKRHKVLTINYQAPAQEVTIHESEYAQQTDFMHMESIDSAKTAYALLIPVNELPAAEEGPDKKKYYNIKSGYPAGDGYEYVREDHLQRGASLEWLKYYDQSEGDKIGIFQDTVAYWDIESDGTLDEKEALNPLFKQLLLDLHMDTDGDGELSKKEAGQLKIWSMKQEMAADILKAAIKHSNEWRSSNATDMAGFLELIRKQAPEVAQAHQDRLQALQIPTVANVSFDTSATFIHPLAMIFGLMSSTCISLKKAKEIALAVSGGFEGNTPSYATLSGNHDGQGMSWGIIQWNFGQDTLGPLLRKMKAKNITEFENAFTNKTDLNSLNKALNGSINDQKNWAINMQNSNNKRWREIFNNLSAVTEFQEIQLEGVEKYDKAAVNIIEWMRSRVPEVMRKIELVTFIALHDLAVQQYGISSAKKNIEAIISKNKPLTQDEFIRIVVTERAKTARQVYVADCMSRRLGILNKKATKKTVHGKTANRGNINFYLIEDGYICDL